MLDRPDHKDGPTKPAASYITTQHRSLNLAPKHLVQGLHACGKPALHHSHTCSSAHRYNYNAGVRCRPQQALPAVHVMIYDDIQDAAASVRLLAVSMCALQP
jgi:hypothetical protein